MGVLGDLEYSEFKGFKSMMFAIYFLQTLLGRMNRELHRYVYMYLSKVLDSKFTGICDITSYVESVDQSILQRCKH